MIGISPWPGLGLSLALTAAAPADPSATDPAAPPSADENATSDEPPPQSEPIDTPSAAVRAQQHFRAEQWDEAIEAIMEAYAADPDPAYLYARAQAERMRGNCRVAIPLYERFLGSGTTERQREDTERHIRLCEEILFNERSEPDVDPTPVVPFEPASNPAPVIYDDDDDDPPRGRQWARDPAGMTLLVTGVAATTVGAVFWGRGTRIVRDAPLADIEQDYEGEVQRGRRSVAAGASVTGVGLAMLAGGIIRLVIVGRRSRVSTSAWLRPDHAGLRLSTRF